MADQTIEIKLVLRDELTRQLAPIIAEVKKLQDVNLGRPASEMRAFGRTVQVVHRELSMLARISLGGLIGARQRLLAALPILQERYAAVIKCDCQVKRRHSPNECRGSR
jgi:hypothetical protein